MPDPTERRRWWHPRPTCPLVSYDECLRVCIPADECAAHTPTPRTTPDTTTNGDAS